ncbi:hypothetical protein [Methanococcoides alaskense]|uniref:Uncharacterized protein n=1 Tax=Methanococcoides alaskense TaxID=325778 RepID=A0AA90U1A7_9EURY|nr:hypothetical protein [Methanococcoides alaskense]MDA0524152.1 hypothetical protein [Methanococcoides alaskense]MDR6223857.1 hypothetical protein [Methanococcoides alaskense]
MKELKVSISDELFKGLSDVKDRDSFVAALLKKELERAECKPQVSNSSSNDADVEVVMVGDGLDIMPVLDDVGEPAISSPDVLNEPGDNGKYVSIEKMACFQQSIADMANRIDELEDKISDMNIVIFNLMKRSSVNDDASVDGVSADDVSVDCVSADDVSVDDVSAEAVSVEAGGYVNPVSDQIVATSGSNSTVPNDLVIKLPYATLSFPELKIPPELLPDEDGLSMKEGTFVQGILSSVPLTGESISSGSPDPTPFETLVSLRQDPFTNEVRETESSSNDLEPPLENLLGRSVPSTDNFAYLVEQSVISSKTLPSSTPNVPVTSMFAPSGAQVNNNLGVSSVEVVSKAPSASEGPLPVPDRLESSILAYLPFGSEVKKDVIKNLLPKRYTNDDLETKINQLLASGKVSNIVKDGIVHLTRTSR